MDARGSDDRLVKASRERSGQRSHKHSGRHHRRKEKRRRRELRRIALATGFVTVEFMGFCLANFAVKDSWTELTGFLLLQPVQILLNLIDSHYQLTRGLRDADAVLLVTLISLPLNVLLGYWVWRGWRRVRRAARRSRHAPGKPYGAAPLPSSESVGTRSRFKVAPIDTGAAAGPGNAVEDIDSQARSEGQLRK